MKLNETSLPGVHVIDNKAFKDERGFFSKTFHLDTFRDWGLEIDFKECFFSSSQRGVIRGMHLQTPPHDNAKIVWVSSGSVLDAVVDLRKNSPTFGKYVSLELSADNFRSVYVPRGCAHGYIITSGTALVNYLQTSTHSPSNDTGVRWDSFGMDWGNETPIVSERDAALPLLKDFDSPFK